MEDQAKELSKEEFEEKFKQRMQELGLKVGPFDYGFPFYKKKDFACVVIPFGEWDGEIEQLIKYLVNKTRKEVQRGGDNDWWAYAGSFTAEELTKAQERLIRERVLEEL